MTCVRRFASKCRPCSRAALILLAAAFAASAGGCGLFPPKSVTVPTKFTPTEHVKMSTFAGTLPETPIYLAPVNDARQQKEQIGENSEEKPIPIYFSGEEPAALVERVMRTYFAKAGLQLAADQSSAGRTVQADLVEFWVQEKDDYDAEVRAAVTVRDRSGRQLWKGVVNGTATQFGRSLSQQNYQESSSNATVKFVYELLSNPGFREALGGRAEAYPSPAGPAGYRSRGR